MTQEETAQAEGRSKRTPEEIVATRASIAKSQARRRELIKLLKAGGEVDCLNPAAYLLMGGLRLQLMLDGCRDEELAQLNQCWVGAKEGEA